MNILEKIQGLNSLPFPTFLSAGSVMSPGVMGIERSRYLSVSSFNILISFVHLIVFLKPPSSAVEASETVFQANLCITAVLFVINLFPACRWFRHDVRINITAGSDNARSALAIRPPGYRSVQSLRNGIPSIRTTAKQCRRVADGHRLKGLVAVL